MQDAPRLYLAESVAAVIEVKSNLMNQWDEVLATRDKLRPIRRAWRSRDAGAKGGAPTAIGTMSGESVERIPLIAVGYTGWKTIDTVQKKLEEAGLHCVLVLDEGLAAGPMGHNATGDASLGLLLETLQMAFGAVTMNSGALFPYWK